MWSIDFRMLSCYFKNWILRRMVLLLKKNLLNIISKKRLQNFKLCHVCFFFQFGMSSNSGDNRNLSFNEKSKLGLSKVLLRNAKKYSWKSYTKCSWNKLTTTHWKNWFQRKMPSLFWKWTLNNCRRKMCVNLMTDRDKNNILVNRCRKTLHLKDNDIKVKMKRDQKLLKKRVFFELHWHSFQEVHLLDETNFHNWNTFSEHGMLSFCGAFADFTRY